MVTSTMETGKIIRESFGKYLIEYSVTIRDDDDDTPEANQLDEKPKLPSCGCNCTEPDDLGQICLSCGSTLKYK